ncbi:MAG: hypothetical protein ACYC7E_01815 [Armatimonadota bacterium]
MESELHGMDSQSYQEEQHKKNTLESKLEEIVRATSPPPARLPACQPANIPATTSDTNATTSLVLGIINLCIPVLSFPSALLGLILGIIANKHAAGTARIGIILNSIALGISVLAGIIFLLILLQR